jgi:hypothetical protein
MNIDLDSGHWAAKNATRQLLTELDGSQVMNLLQILPYLKDILGAVADQKVNMIIATFDGDYSLIEQVSEAMEEFDTEHLDHFDLGFHEILKQRLSQKCIDSR